MHQIKEALPLLGKEFNWLFVIIISFKTLELVDSTFSSNWKIKKEKAFLLLPVPISLTLNKLVIGLIF